MFKAKLIDNNGYYKIRSRHLALMLLPTIPIAFLANFYLFSWPITALVVACYVIVIIIISKNQKLLDSMIGQSIIEIDKNEIRIKSKQNNAQEAINPSNIDKIIVPNEFGIAQETMKDITNEISGNPKKNYLIIHQNNEARKFDFELDSHYMIIQLNKIIDHWTLKGLKIERI